MTLCAMSINWASFYKFSIGVWSYSDSVVFSPILFHPSNVTYIRNQSRFNNGVLMYWFHVLIETKQRTNTFLISLTKNLEITW